MDSDSIIRWFESSRPSQTKQTSINACLLCFINVRVAGSRATTRATLAKLQEIKYNKDKPKYASLQIEFEDEKVRRKLGTDELPLTIQADKQGKHIKGHKNFTDDKSYLAVETVEEGIKLSQEIVDKYHGKGMMQRDLKGEWKHTELIISDRVIGFVTNKDGKLCKTVRAIIHYSKSGTHIVPTLRGVKNE